MIPKIASLTAREILDSRGNPTVEATVILDDGSKTIASVPSGASVGKYEALELRDEDVNRFEGKGVLKAIENIEKKIAPKLKHFPIRPQLEIDRLLLELDGTKNKANLGANATLAVSMACCKAAAISKQVSLFQHIADLYGSEAKTLKIPVPIFNLINGGKHGAGNLDFQEFHIIPSGAKNFFEGLRLAAEIYQATKKVLIQYQAIHSVGDEGGFAPNLFTNLDALETLKKAIEKTNYRLQQDVYLGLDVAANHFYRTNKYKIKDKTNPLSTSELIDYYTQLHQEYHLLSLEDPLFEDDWNSWAILTSKLSDVMIVGDDLLATNKERLNQGIEKKACNAILVKPNQIGTVAETIEVVKIAKNANWKVVVSHRSGETCDTFIADFAVGIGADYVKFGAPARGERVVKYNRLVEIENLLKRKTL